VRLEEPAWCAGRAVNEPLGVGWVCVQYSRYAERWRLFKLNNLRASRNVVGQITIFLIQLSGNC
jgi:hypothetical protein